MVDLRRRNRRMVQQALDDNSWIQDLDGELTFTGHIQFLNLCHAIANIPRDTNTPDKFTWPVDASGQYTARSVYIRLCQGLERVPYAACIWRSTTPLKCKIHVSQAVQHQIWMSDRRARHGLQDHRSPCYTCLQEEDNAEHIHIQCPYARQVWHKCFNGLNLMVPWPQGHDNLLEWWLQARSNFTRANKRTFDTLVVAVA